MKIFGYKNYLTKSIIKRSTNIETHNQIVREFLSTMRYGNLPFKRKNDYVIIEQDDTHTSFYVETNENIHYDSTNNNVKSYDYTYMVYTLSYDTQHSVCQFDIEEKQLNNVMGDDEIVNKASIVIQYNEIDDYCMKLVNDLGLIKRNLNKNNNTTNNQSIQRNNDANKQNKQVDTNDDFDNKLLKEIYNKSTRLQEIDIDITDDVAGIKNPKFMKSRGVQFKVQDMIGDNMFRHINAVKQKAEASLINWQKTAYINNEENENTIACDIFHVALENSVSNNASKKIELTKESLGSKNDFDISKFNTYEINKLLSVYPPEALSPLVFLSMDDSIKWGREDNKTSKQILNDIFGDDNVFKRGLISYDASVSGELIDSEVAIPTESGKYRKIGISTKGGLNGVGAQASLISIFRLLFDKETREYDSKKNDYKTSGHIFSKDISNIFNNNDIENNIESFVMKNCSKYGIEIFNVAKTELSLVLIFGGLKPIYHTRVIEAILKRKKLFDMNIKLPRKFDIRTEFCNFVNSNFNVTRVIMEILNKQKYDFAQVNALPVMNGSSFNYEWSIQYPAHFNGTVKLETRNTGIGFHIHGA